MNEQNQSFPYTIYTYLCDGRCGKEIFMYLCMFIRIVFYISLYISIIVVANYLFTHKTLHGKRRTIEFSSTTTITRTNHEWWWGIHWCTPTHHHHPYYLRIQHNKTTPFSTIYFMYLVETTKYNTCV